MKAKGDRNLSQERTGRPASTESSETGATSTLWTPEEFAAHLPDGPLASSRGTADWEGIVVERRSQAPQELAAAPMTHHLLGLVLGQPFHFWRKIGGEVAEGLRVPGSTTLIPAGQPRLARWDATADLLHLHISPQFLAQAAQDYHAHPDRIELIPEFSVPDPQIEHIGKALLAELEQGAPGGRLFGESLATALALHLLRRYIAFPATMPDRTSKLSRTELRRALEYIHDNLANQLSLKELAEVAGVSVYHFVMLFKQTTGLPPHQYLLRQRVEQAKTLLDRDDLSITQIAYQVGFYDSSHLARCFKRLTGVTPSTMRKKR